LIQRIVVSCRMSYAGVLSRDAGYLERARALGERASALGGTLAAWSAVTLAFSWDASGIDGAIVFATEAVQDRASGKDPWASGIAEGSMEPFSPDDAGDTRASLGWGTPLVDAVALARIAAPGEVLVDARVEALSAGELLVVGSKISFDAGRRVRGARLDIRQPWRTASAAQIARLVDAPLVGREAEVLELASSPGAVALLRADPGLGGSRVLAELRARAVPSKALLLTPSAARSEPLGALRRAFTQIAASEPLTLDPSLHAPLDHLLSGEGIGKDHATQLVGAYLTAKGPPPALLIDDAIEIDGSSLEVCLKAATWSPVKWIIVVRVDALTEVPSLFGALPRGAETELKPLVPDDAAEIAELVTRGALPRPVAARWARRGGFTPLGVIEAVTSGLATGDLAWVEDAAYARRRAAGKGTPRPASYWIDQRAGELSPEARAVLVALALLGGSAPLGTLTVVVGRMSSSVDIRAELQRLAVERWVRPSRAEDWVELPTRSHRQAVLQLVNDARSRAWHRAIAEEIEKAGGAFQNAEAAQHAAKAGDGPWAARLAAAAATRATELGHDKAAMRLAAFARAQDPEMQELSDIPDPASSARLLSIPPGPLSVPPPPSMVPVPTGVTRMKALGELSRGHATQAVRTLRAELDRLGEAGSHERSKAALALGLALVHAGETEEALLSALEGLARAREGGDERGERACMMLIAKVLAPAEGDARRVREAAEAKV
jgi:hypothetical protein